MALVDALFFVALFCSATASSHCEDQQGVDRTLEEEAVGAEVVDATASKIKESGIIFEDDHQFLRRMAAVETNNGDDFVPNTGGIWRVNDDIFRSAEEYISINISLQNEIEERLCFNWFINVRSIGYGAMDTPLYSALYVMVYLKFIERSIPESIESQATLWREVFRDNAGNEEEFIIAAMSLADSDLQCQIKGVDMVFVMDESGSIQKTEFEQMKELAINITESFEIAPDRTRVGWISFSSSARVVINLNQYDNKTSLHDAIRGIQHHGGSTAIGEALYTLWESGFAGAHENFDIPEVAVVVTDGHTNRGVNTSYAAGLLRRDRNVNVFAVGVGDGVNYAELDTITTAGIENDQDHVYNISGFVDDELITLQRLIRARTCFDAMFSSHTTSIERLSRNNVNIPQRVTVHVAVTCPPEGLTINACGREGKTILYISQTRSPNSANYDKKLTIKAGKCRNTFVPCPDDEDRDKRQTSDSEQRVFVTIEGVDEVNEYDLNATIGDTSTPQVNLLCSKRVTDDRQGVVVRCSSDRELIDIKCSSNGSPAVSCTLPWKVAFTPPTREYTLEINVTDSLNLTDSDSITHTVGPLVLVCQLDSNREIVCLSNNELNLNQTVCSYRGTTIHQCVLPYRIDVRGWPLGTHTIHVRGTDVFGSTAETTFHYLVVADRVGDDMVFSAVLDISPVEVGVSDQTVFLCYQVHGEKGKFYNLVSDDCLSINAHVSQPIAGVNSHVMDEIGIRAVGSNRTCYDIAIVRENCEVTVNNITVSINSRFEEEGVRVFNDRMIARDPNVVHISVPNCGRALVDVINVMCSDYKIRNSPTATEVLELMTTRGISPIEAAQGLVGQFWGRFMLGQSQPPLPPPRQRYDKAMMIFHSTTLKKFSGFIRRSWSHKDMCFYAGDRQGYPVIQGQYGDYEVEGLFSTEYNFSRFRQDLCVGSGSGI